MEVENRVKVQIEKFDYKVVDVICDECLTKLSSIDTKDYFNVGKETIINGGYEKEFIDFCSFDCIVQNMQRFFDENDNEHEYTIKKLKNEYFNENWKKDF